MVYELFEKHWKYLMFFTIILLVASSAVLVNNLLSKGSVLDRDVELSGGKMITASVVSADLISLAKELPYASIHLASGQTKSLIVNIPLDINESDVIAVMRKHADIVGEPSIRTVGPVLGTIFFQQAMFALAAAFVMMVVIVFLLFRSFMPSFIVVLAATTDIVVSLAVLHFLGVKLSLAVLAAILTVIGYSVDTDILLTSEMLKSGSRNVKENINKAMKTGLTMTGTTLVALLAIYFFSGSVVLQQIAFVLMIGLIVDVPATWWTNAGLLRWYFEKRVNG